MAAISAAKKRLSKRRGRFGGVMARAMKFVDERFSETYLWTFKGLDAARHLYESLGFQLTEESEGTQWGTTVVEQRFNRRSA